MNIANRILVIVNPISGTKDKADIVAALSSHRLCHIETTTKPGDATTLAATAARQGAKAVIAVGGDGTVRETALGLIGSPTPLGIIPTGSGNGLARHLRIPMNVRKALAVIEAWHIVDCDYGTAAALPFLCTMGIGFDAEVSRRFALTSGRGPFNYVCSTLAAFHSYTPRTYSIALPDRTITRKALLITVANATQYGNNARIAPQASITDGLLDIIILNAGDPINTLRAAVQIFTGQILQNPLIETYQTPSLSIVPRPVSLHDIQSPAIHLDGEPMLSPRSHIDISIHPAALRILCPSA